jgi:hypothetical protein
MKFSGGDIRFQVTKCPTTKCPALKYPTIASDIKKGLDTKGPDIKD